MKPVDRADVAIRRSVGPAFDQDRALKQIRQRPDSLDFFGRACRRLLRSSRTIFEVNDDPTEMSSHPISALRSREDWMFSLIQARAAFLRATGLSALHAAARRTGSMSACAAISLLAMLMPASVMKP